MKPQKSDFAPVHFSTEDLPERDRLALYREQFGRNLFHLDIEPLPDCPFRAELTIHAFPGVFIASNVGGGLREWRTSEMTADSRDEFAFVINLRGPTIIAQRGREFVMDEQSATLGVLDEIGGIMRPTLGHRLHVLHMPRATLSQLVRHAEHAVMRPIPRYSASLRLLRAYVAMLQRSDITHDPSIYALIGSHVHDLVAATIGATSDAMETARARGVRAARLATIRADVLANLADARLTAETIGRRHGISGRYVHMLFAETGQSFGRFVEEERLKRAFALLTHPTRAVRKIGEIASTVGFPEPSMFSRAFRRRFGDTPSGVRRSRVDQSGLP